MKPKYPIVPIVALVLCMVIFGFTFRSNSGGKTLISWSERALTWEDFREVDFLEEDYLAVIHSNINCPDLITEKNSRVYAYMNPNRSERLRDNYDGHNVLVHEQYHFNLTEYCARLLRKDIVERGLGGLSYETMKSLKTRYSKKLDSLQTLYDSITDHNVNGHLQRYWELQIDDWLRQTASYENEDIYQYYNFTKKPTVFFKEIYFTFTQRVLASYPVGQEDMAYSEVYEVIYPTYQKKETIVKFYKEGKPTNGGNFGTAITKIIEKEDGNFEVHYLNADESYNTEKTVCIRKIDTDKHQNKTEQFFNFDGKRIDRDSVYEIKWSYDPGERSYYATFLNKEGQKIANHNGIFHEKKTMDEKNRTITEENFDQKHHLKNDARYIARYETAYSDEHKILFKRYYDENGDFALHLNDYHLSYDYDERGRSVRITSLDANGNRTYDHNGASIYEYTYDIHDRQTSVKRFNIQYMPIVADDDYFQKITDFDTQGRIILEAEYYPDYVLRFSDKKDGARKHTYESDTLKKIYNIDAYNNVFENDHNVAITIQTLNSRKEIVRESYRDAHENFAKRDDGGVIYRYKYDDRGNKIETAVYDSIDRPWEFEADVATIRWEYDNSGNKLKTTYFTKNNELAFANDSVTYNLYSYNERNQLIARRNFDKNMKPAEIDGTHKTFFMVNRFGLDSIIEEYNAANILKDGVAITKYHYNKYGNKTQIAYYDRNNKRTRNKNGISAIKYSYNQRQSVIRQEYLDEHDRLANNEYGVGLETWELDDLLHTLAHTYYDKDKKPAIGNYGYHRVDYEWNLVGQYTKSIIYGPDLELIPDEYGTAIYEYTLAPSGMVKTIKRYNENNVLADNTNNVAITQYETGLNGLYFIEKELNALGEIVNDTL